MRASLAVALVLCCCGPAYAQNSNVNPTPGALWTYMGPTYGAGWTTGSGTYGVVPTQIGHPAVWNNTAGTALNMPEQFQMTPTIAGVNGDSPANSAIWINATRSGTTSTGNYDNALVTWLQTETMTGTVNARGIDTLLINHVFGGGEGSRSGIFVNIQNSAATANPASTHSFYTAIFGNVSAAVTDSPTGTNKGDFYSFGGQTTVYAGVKAHGAIGAEFDVGAQSGASVTEKMLLQLVLYNSDAVRGTNIDAGIVLSNGSPGTSPGLADGIVFGKPGYPGSWPFTATSNIIQARGTADTPNAAANSGIDFSLVNFAGCAFASKGFCVTDGSPGILLQRPFPTIDFNDTQIANPATKGGYMRITTNGNGAGDVYQFQINTAPAGDFSAGTTPFSVYQTGVSTTSLTVAGVLNLSGISGGGTANRFVCVDASGIVVLQTAAC
jgi:hypothetical protein